MSRNLSYKGKGQDTGPVALPVGDDHQDTSLAKRNGKSASRLSLSTPSARRTDRAIDDAQSSLDSLIKAPYSHTDRSRPQVISSSGRVRNETRGRIAAPSSLASDTHSATKTARPLYILGEGLDDGDDKALAIVPGTVPLYGPDGETREVPNTALGRGMALATGTLQTAKEHAGLLLGTLDTPNGLGLADAETLHTSRRAASQWATRYATHLVVLLVVGMLVALGGLRALTTEGSYASDLHSAEELGTDHFHDAEAEFGGEAIDSPDFVIALPRTELGGADAAANSIVAPLGPSGEEAQVPPQQPQTQPAPAPIGKVTEYTVAAGDTVGSIAAKFNVMPETVMGSNGIYDSEEVLATGRVLAVPPIDGMHYVAREGDTVQSIADRFQVDAEVITSFAGNNLANGTVAVGQAVIVPGGMMPPRDVALLYTVRKGDTLKRVVARYGIDVPTVLHANDIPDPDNLSIGSELRLLPVSGLEYEIQKGDTIFSIADKLGVSAEMILDYPPNGLKADSVLQIGAKIMVPGGSPPVVMAARVAPPASKEEPAPQPSAKQKPAESKAAAKPAAPVKPPSKPEPAPKPPPPAANKPKAGTGNMVWPVRGRITQYFSGRHNGLDIATKAGTPIHAADSGKIIYSGWRTDGLGYCVIIDHMNGITTIYGHMIRQPPVRVGSYVDRNQIIGYIGSTGRSTGPHVHFMVKTGGGKTYRNPLAYLGK